MSTVDKLQDLVTAKEDMKTALIEKGMTPTGGLSTYADCIRDITSLPGKLPDKTKLKGSSIEVVPMFDTTEMTDMSDMFYCCYDLKRIPQFNTSNVTDMSGMFYACDELVSVPELDGSNLIDVNDMFRGCNKLNNFGGLKNLGKQQGLKNSYFFLYLDSAPLTYESVMNFINNLYDRASAGYSIITIRLGVYNIDKLSDDEKSIATQRGWILS